MMRLAMTIILLFFYLPVLSQVTESRTYALSGLVTGSKGVVIPYSSVSLHKIADSSQVAAGATDEKGRFRFSIAPGSYFLKISYLTYEEKRVSDIIITNKDMDLGTIMMNTATKLLTEVVVTSEKKLMELDLDKRVYNVSLDVSNIGANASEILSNIPSVTVDIDGNVSLRGSQGVRILIDGKPSALTGIRSTDALRNLQGAMIERIEVITNPSSRYDAAGETGIINFILKKNRTIGFNGNFTGTAGIPGNFSAAYSINYRTQKMNLFSSFGTNYRRNPGKGSSTQQFTGTDTSFVYDQTNNRTRRDFSVNLMAGIDYYITPNTTLTGSFLIDGGREKNLSKILYEDFDQSGQLVRNILRTDNEKAKEQDTEVSLSFRKKFPGNNDKEWIADFKWTNSGETESSDYTQENFTTNELLKQRSGNPAYEDNILLQTDYVHPFKEDGKFEIGFKGTIRTITNEFLVEEQTGSGNWVTLPAFDNNMEFTEKVYAVYTMMGNKIKQFSYQIGLRGELTDMRTGLVKTNEVNKRNYFNLFPSGNIAYELNEKNTLQLSYSYRINRPNFRNLTPFADFSDPRIYFVGNPNLNPEFSHSMEVGHLLDWGKGSLLSGIYYRHKKGVVERIRLLDTVTGISNIIPVNLSTQNDIGIEMAFSLTVSDWWKFNSNFNFYHAVAKGAYNDILLQSQTTTWTNRTASRMTFFKQVDFQASLNYQSPRITTQGKDLSIYSIDLGLAKDVFKGKGTLTLNVRDLLNSRRRRSIVDIPGYYSKSDFLWRPRQITVTLNFRLNQQKIEKKEERNDEGGMDN
ncbi:MAG: TonB-dependent receptor [Chitinophagaceae bacterium]|nr:TonB-dependent receptor [Chitinophagaceae bacterium]